MSRPSFRPRPIDLTKPLPIIKTSKDLRNEDDVVVNRALPTIATGVDPAEEEERHLQQALMASVFGETKRAPANIPIPVTEAVEPPAIPGASFRLPEQYIMFDKSDHDLEDACVDYDADHVDNTFVAGINKAKPNNTPLTMDVLERAMDAMEKAQGRSENGDTLVPYATVRQTLALAEVAGAHPESTRRELHAHWHKRRTERGFPFLRLYQQAPDPTNNDPAVAFRPRDKDNMAGAGRRMNTYDNFRRAVILRDELKQLISIMDRVVDRETHKSQLLGLRLLQQRVALAASGGPRIESVTRALFSGEQEPVVAYGPQQMQVLVPCRNLRLPPEISVVLRRLGATAAEKAAKKARRRATPRSTDKNKLGRDQGQVSSANQRTSSGGLPTGVDTFGYDEVGNRFLKDMRFFAGGFMNYGVSPYDHRVFAAASERNTVRVNPKEPRPVLFPGPQVRFGSLQDTDQLPYGGMVGEKMISCDDIRADIFDGRKRRVGEAFHPSTNPSRKIRRSYYTRARVGRGGRVMLDRVIFQRERGVKAASYPASVEGGGVYTAGIPLDAASRTSRIIRRGGMGDIFTLGAGIDEEEGEQVSDTEESESLALARKLIPSLKPIVRMNAGIGVEPDAVNYWPRRHGGKTRGGKRKRGQVRREHAKRETSDDWEQRLKSLPSYAPRETPLVTQV